LNIVSKSILIVENVDYSSQENHNMKFNITCAEFNKKEGWHLLNLKTYEPFSNEIQSYYAGYLEGYIYHELIGFHYINIFKTIFHNKELPDNLKEFMRDQQSFVNRLVKEKTEGIVGNIIFTFIN